jgi:polyphosphate kinase
MKRLLVAPFDLHERLLALIARETKHAKRGLPARIIAKINSLAEPQIIHALYRASQAGVKIELIVRGVCCLRPGVPGVSENITVRSLVDRFLEHTRIYYFENACDPQVFLGSADWLPRNLFRRIETVFPIVDGILRERLISEVLGTVLADNTKARLLFADGTYHRATRAAGEAARRSQVEFLAFAANLNGAKHPRAKGANRYPRVQLLSSPFKQ